MIAVGLKLGLLYAFIMWFDGRILSWSCLMRPIVLAPLSGLVMGDIRTGILMGAALESVYMGIVHIGGATPADAPLAAVITTAFAILTDAGMEAAIALSIPIGTVMASFNSLCQPIWAGVAPSLTKMIVKGEVKKFEISAHLLTIAAVLVPGLACAAAVAFGVEGLESLLTVMPGWVMTGMRAAGSMMMAIGFAILTSMIWSKEVGYFFFFGYVLVKYLGMDTLAIAILGAIVAATVFLSEKRTIDLKNKLEKMAAVGGVTKEEEEFF